MEEKLVPKLRFPEFEGEWNVQKIGKFVEERSSFPDNKLPLYSLTIEHGVVPKTERYERSFLVRSDGKNYKLMKPADFAFNPMNLRFGALAMHKEDHDVVVSKYYNIFYVLESGIPEYFENYLKTYNMIQFYEKMATGTLEEKKRVHYLDFIHFKKPIPSKPEQQKIASFLSAVDTKIEQLTRKKEVLEQYKKGVMQKLFPKPGEQHPELRFKQEDGSDFPDWEVKRFDQIATIKMGQSPDSNSYNDEADGIYLIQGNADIKDRETFPRQWTSDPTKTCEEGDLILTVRAPVGYICISTHRACIGRGVCSISRKGSNDQNYIYQYLLNYEPYWVRLEQGSTFTAVSGGDIKSLKIPVPSYLEQQSISNFLSHLDRKIKSMTVEIDKAQNFKKGLLQQMFV